MTSPPSPDRPLVRVVSGNPDPAELAALIAVVAARAQEDASVSPEAESVWSAKSRQVRPSLRPGPNAWRTSTWPR
jgi:hypothetical protein